MKKLSKWIVRHAGWVVFFSTLLALISSFFTFLLYSNLRPDFEELLPLTARSVVDANLVRERMSSSDYLAVLVLSQKDANNAKRFISDLAKRLEKHQPNSVAYLEFDINKEKDFFYKRRALFLDLTELQAIRNYIRDRIRYEKDKAFSIFGDLDWDEPHFDFEALKHKYEQQSGRFSHYPDGYYALEDGKTRALLVGIPNRIKNINGSYHLRKIIDQEIAALDLGSYGNDIQIKFTGGVQDLIEEHASLIKDLALVTFIVLILTILIMYIFYRTSVGVVAILISLVYGALWTGALSYFLNGYVNMNSAFMSAIIIGNGVNFGIIFLARYLEELRLKKGHERAILLAFVKTPKATLTAALAAGAAYGSLTFTDFRGFQQFGIMGLLGMVLCWLAAYTVLPALLTVARQLVIPRYLRRMDKNVSLVLPKKEFFMTPWLKRNLIMILAFTIFFTALSAAMMVPFSKSYLETDLTKMRDINSLERGSGYYSSYLHKIFKGYPHPLAVMVENSSDTEKVAHALKQQMKKSDSRIGKVLAPGDFVPNQQHEKIKVLSEIKDLLKDPLLKWSSSEQQKEINSYLTPESFQVFGVRDLPEIIQRRMSERDGSIGKLILVEPIIGKTESLEDLTGFIREVRETVDAQVSRVAVAGQLAVSSDLVEEVNREGPKTTAIALFAVSLLVLILFRDLRISGLLLGSIIFGTGWMLGIMALFGLKINFINFIALPISLGISVDYGVNILERYSHEGRGGMLRALRYTGSAVLLASLTTIIGYGGLVIAGNQAIVSFGQLAVIGELTCLFTALLSVPAIVILQDYRKQKKQSRLSTVT